MPKKVLIFLSLLLAQQTIAYSQQYFFRNYSVEQGLPQSSVYCLIQDARGFFWMGTDGGGVSRFDGHTFQTFSKSEGLSDNVVRSLFEDSKGNIWIGTDNGLTLYDGYNFSAIGKEQGLKGSSVLKIMEARSGVILAATNDGGLATIITSDSLTVKNITSEDGLTSDFIFDIYEDPQNMIWLAMVGGLNIIDFGDSASQAIKEIYTPEIDTESVISILSIEPSENGSIFLGSYGNGLYRTTLSADKNDLKIKSSEINEAIPGMIIWDLLTMSNGEIWMATDKNGVIRVSGEKVTSIFNKESGLQSNQILDILEDRDGNLWFASFGQGAMMYAGEKFISYDESDGIIGTQILDILFTPENIFYTATEEGLMRFRKEGIKIQRLNYYNVSNGLNASGVSVIEKINEHIWAGTKNGINVLKGPEISGFRGNRKLKNSDISTLLAGHNDDIWIGTAGGYARIFDDNLFFMNQEEGLINDEIQTIIEDKKGRIWLGTMGGLVRLEGKTYKDFNAEDGLTTLKINTLAEDPSGNILIGTFGGGIFRFDTGKDSLPISLYAKKGVLSSNSINSLRFLEDTLLIAGNDKGFDLLVVGKDQAIKKVIHNTLNDGFLGGENNPNAISTDNDGYIWFGTKKGLVRYNPSYDLNYKGLPEPYITGVRLFYEDVDWAAKDFRIMRFSSLPEDLVLSYKNNHLTFTFTGLSYYNPDELQFSYFLENQSKEWSPYSSDRDVLFSGLTPGSYNFKVRSKNKFGLTGNIAEYKFIINPPFWQTPWFLIPSLILFIILIIVIMRIRERKLIREKIKLEKIVDERTKEVVEQKDEIARQRDVVTYQKKEITDSIQYAERIQRAVLPVETVLKNRVSDYFILFRPKDIVSGDFYWMAEKADHLVFTAADCTGHGVPGAFMSMLGVSFLNKIVNEEGVVQPDQILNSLREEIIASLKQEGTVDTNKDGMDIALCSIDLKKMMLRFAGANNPLLILRKENGEYVVNQIKGDKMPVSFYTRMDEFTNHEFELKKGDTIYLFSDGFEDQFGGPDGKKFMKARINKMLIENQELPMAEQREVYSKVLDEWMSQPSANWTPMGQIDDVIIMGIRI
jgi:ligand-binding sensor domain-containing protein/serine phosphatase RsbU (regulator of sigma subunit)